MLMRKLFDPFEGQANAAFHIHADYHFDGALLCSKCNRNIKFAFYIERFRYSFQICTLLT
jgi:hypothetical protein